MPEVSCFAFKFIHLDTIRISLLQEATLKFGNEKSRLYAEYHLPIWIQLLKKEEEQNLANLQQQFIFFFFE